MNTEPYIAITTTEQRRIAVSRWDAPSGRSLVALKPEYQDHHGEWHLTRSSVTFPPRHAAEMAAAIVETAAQMDDVPVAAIPPETREAAKTPR